MKLLSFYIPASVLRAYSRTSKGHQSWIKDALNTTPEPQTCFVNICRFAMPICELCVVIRVNVNQLHDVAMYIANKPYDCYMMPTDRTRSLLATDLRRYVKSLEQMVAFWHMSTESRQTATDDCNIAKELYITASSQSGAFNPQQSWQLADHLLTELEHSDIECSRL